MADSLLDGIDFALTQPLFANPQLRTQAIHRFRCVVDHFQACEPPRFPNKKYNRPALVRFTFEYARSPESQDRFLSAFFHRLRLGMADADGDINLDDNLHSLLFAFADDLMNNFFIPLRAAGGQPTPQLTPLSHDAIQQTQTQGERDKMKAFTGTSRRLAALRQTCLVRDRHRCVVTRAFDHQEVIARVGRTNLARDDGVEEVIPQDDDGNEFPHDENFAKLEVAHILPHSLTKQKKGELDKKKRGALDILNMFDVGIVDQIDGADIDQPRNAMSMIHDMHSYFGEFKIVFQRIPGTAAHTYRIKAFNQWTDRRLPLTRTLLPHPTIPAPSERLLALHCAIGHILHLSAAAEYIDRFLDDMDDGMVQADGSTPLDAMVRVALEMKG